MGTLAQLPLEGFLDLLMLELQLHMSYINLIYNV